MRTGSYKIDKYWDATNQVATIALQHFIYHDNGEEKFCYTRGQGRSINFTYAISITKEEYLNFKQDLDTQAEQYKLVHDVGYSTNWQEIENKNPIT